MSHHESEQEVERLTQLNDELSRSLKRCRRILHDYEGRLTANSNEQDSPDASKIDPKLTLRLTPQGRYQLRRGD